MSQRCIFLLDPFCFSQVWVNSEPQIQGREPALVWGIADNFSARPGRNTPAIGSNSADVLNGFLERANYDRFWSMLDCPPARVALLGVVDKALSVAEPGEIRDGRYSEKGLGDPVGENASDMAVLQVPVILPRSSPDRPSKRRGS